METGRSYDEKNNSIDVDTENMNNQEIILDVLENEINQEQKIIYLSELFQYPITVRLLKNIFYARIFWINIFYKLVSLLFFLILLYYKHSLIFILYSLFFLLDTIYRIIRYYNEKKEITLEIFYMKIILFIIDFIQVFFFLAYSQILQQRANIN